MIVEPTPTTARTPLRRGLRVAGLVTPIVLLVGVVAVGLGAPDTPTPAPPAATPLTAPVARASAAPLPVPAPAFPTVGADLAVRSIPEARAWLDALKPGPVAVAGWLTDLYPYGACPAEGGDTRGALGPLCARRARLDAGPGGTDADVHVHLTIPAGTRLPPVLERVDRPAAPLAVVVVGHTGEKQIPCEATDDDCRSDLVVERVTWADGTPFDPGPVYDAYLAPVATSFLFQKLDSAEALAIGWYGTVLQAALIRPTTVARVDPVAAAAMAAGPPAHELVWYVRGLETGYDPVHALHGEAPPRYSWVVLDYDTGATIARGPNRNLRP